MNTTYQIQVTYRKVGQYNIMETTSLGFRIRGTFRY